jgi:hypothetical protein
MTKGELLVFCRDFGIRIPVSKQTEIFNECTRSQPLMALDQFISCVPQLGLEFGKAKAKEVRFLLKELKLVILYPETGVRAQIKRILDEFDPASHTPQES